MRTLLLLVRSAWLWCCTVLLGCAGYTTAPIQALPDDGAQTADAVLSGFAGAAKSYDLVSGIVATFGPSFAWARGPVAMQIADIIGDTSTEALEQIRAHREGTFDGELVILDGDIEFLADGQVTPFKELDPRKQAGILLIASAAFDAVQGGLLQGNVPDSDPVGYGIGCGAVEHGRAQLVNLVLEATLEADGRVVWPRQSLDPVVCEAQQMARSLIQARMALATFDPETGEFFEDVATATP